MRFAAQAPLWLAALGCSACAVGPDYKPAAPTEVRVPEQWYARLPHEGTIGELSQWWLQFDDPLLARMIDTAEHQHPDLDAAIGAIREARASVTDARSGFLPQLNGNASATRNGSAGGGQSSSAVGAGAGANQTYTLFSGGLDASWELDVFGGTRRSNQASHARLTAAQADWDDARISLAAEVADAYVSRRYCERLVSLYEDTLRSRRETLRLTELKFESGFAAPADAAQARAAAYDSENQLVAQRGVCNQNLNRLVALTGLPADALQEELGRSTANLNDSGIPVPSHPAVPSVPAAILSQRPDLVSSERAVAAASADIGVAVASRLPSLTLVGNISFNRLENATSSTRSWYWGPSLSLPIFEGGAGKAREEAARARYDQALARYRGSVLTAVEEVENALTRVDAATHRIEAARLSETNYSQVLSSQENRYQLGATSLLDLEETRRLTLASREALAAVQLEISQSWIALYKAVGGGWNAEQPGAAPQVNPVAPAVSEASTPSETAPGAAQNPSSGAGA